MASSTSVTALVSDYMAKYDHNRNGVIDLKRPDGVWNKLKNPDERVRSKTSVTPGFEQDSINISTSVYTIDRLLYAADKDNSGTVTRDELETAVKKYDTNNDGQLTSRGFWGWLTRKPQQDLDIFKKELGERMSNYGSVDI